MGGMLMKEFLCFRKQAKALLICLAVALAVTAFFRQPQGGNPVTTLSAAIGVATALAVVFTINIMTYEEKTKWNLFVKSLPLSSHAIVGARYIPYAMLYGSGCRFCSGRRSSLLGQESKSGNLGRRLGRRLGNPIGSVRSSASTAV